MAAPALMVTLRAEVPEARRVDLARDLLRDLRRCGFQVEAVPDNEPRDPGARSDFGILTEIAVSIFTQGVATIFAECLNTYAMRERKLRFALKTSDGREILLDPESVTSEQSISFLKSTAHDL